MTLIRQQVLSNSEVRVSDLEHGGSRVRIPPGAQSFSVSSYWQFFTSPFISFIISKKSVKFFLLNIFYKSIYFQVEMEKGS